MKNYIDLGKCCLGVREHYVYLDTEEFLARSLFVRHLIHYQIEGTMVHQDEKYRLYSVKVLKKDEQKFLRAMEELKGKMLLFGHTDYISRGGELMGITRDLFREEAEQTGRIELPIGVTIRTKALPE